MSSPCNCVHCHFVLIGTLAAAQRAEAMHGLGRLAPSTCWGLLLARLHLECPLWHVAIGGVGNLLSACAAASGFAVFVCTKRLNHAVKLILTQLLSHRAQAGTAFVKAKCGDAMLLTLLTDATSCKLLPPLPACRDAPRADLSRRCSGTGAPPAHVVQDSCQEANDQLEQRLHCS